MIRITVLFALFLIAGPAFAEPITGPISKIRDGDTFLIGNQPIRICGIDAPERGSKAGKRSTEYLRKITSGKDAQHRVALRVLRLWHSFNNSPGFKVIPHCWENECGQPHFEETIKIHFDPPCYPKLLFHFSSPSHRLNNPTP